MFWISQIHLDRYLGPLSRYKKIVQKKEWGFREKCIFLKSAFFSKKCITRAFFIFFENNIENVKEGSELSKIMCYTLKSIKIWRNTGETVAFWNYIENFFF